MNELENLLAWWDTRQPPDYDEVYRLIELLRSRVAKLEDENGQLLVFNTKAKIKAERDRLTADKIKAERDRLASAVDRVLERWLDHP